MGWSRSLLLPLLLLLPAGPHSALALLQYRYDCGDFGMQLLAYPSRGRAVRFKVVGEWGAQGPRCHPKAGLSHVASVGFGGFPARPHPRGASRHGAVHRDGASKEMWVQGHLMPPLPPRPGIPTDEFGTRFEVANCSICLHWLNTGADGALVFSSGYEGCHVLVKVRPLPARGVPGGAGRGGVMVPPVPPPTG